MAILKARENSSDTFQPVATMGVGNASQSQRGLMTAQDKVKVDTVGDRPSGETDTLWDKVDTLENRDTYSTTEQVIGTWIDGKPIYRKVLTFTPDSKNYTYTHNIPIDSIVSFRATKSGVSLPVLFVSTTEALLQNSIGCWITQSVVRLIVGSVQTIGDVTCIVEYTKTTD